MVYYKKTEYKFLGFRPSTSKNKKYDGLLQNKSTGKNLSIPFGDSRYENYQDKTGLNLYKTHGDKKRRENYRARHKSDLRKGYYSAGDFSYNILW
jgi:uncharacterized protein (DUF927 family)